MASASVVGAVKERYESFTIAATVPLYFGYVPLKDSSGAAVNPPFVFLEDLGTTPEYDFEYNPLETTRLKLTVYATQLSAVDSTASAIRYNGGTISAGAGLDHAASLPLTDMVLKHVTREQEVRGVATLPNLMAQRVHFCEMTYSVAVRRTA